MPTRLDHGQISFFLTFGFVVLRQRLAAEEISRISRELLCYYMHPVTPDEVAVVRERGELNARLMRDSLSSPRPYLYSADWIANPRRSPARQRWIDRLEQVGCFAPGLVEQR